MLITGESGTGKEVVAQAIHTLSPRSAQPFVPVNCAAIPHDLLESEMFGHERGAFTGAAGSRHGLLTTADGGTIFLDEIGEMPGALQAKLLRVLEDGVVRPVGSDRGTHVNVRVIAASNVDLGAGGGEGRVSRGPLLSFAGGADRDCAAARAALRYPASDRTLSRTHARSPAWRANSRSAGEAMVALWSYDWPGNVRELENMIERLVIMCEDSVIDTSILPPNLVASARPARRQSRVKLTDGGVNLNALVRELEGKIDQRGAQADRRKQAGGGTAAGTQADDLFRQAAALRRDSAGVFGRKRGRLDEQGILWMKQSGRRKSWWSTTTTTPSPSSRAICSARASSPIEANSGRRNVSNWCMKTKST